MNNQENKNDDLWVQCPAGAIQAVADSAIVDRNAESAVDLSRRNLLTATAVAAGVIAFGGVSYLSMRSPVTNKGPMPGFGDGSLATYNYGGINCIEVMRKLPNYIDSKVEDQNEVASIEKHLEMCADCRKVYEKQLEA